MADRHRHSEENPHLFDDYIEHIERLERGIEESYRHAHGDEAYDPQVGIYRTEENI